MTVTPSELGQLYAIKVQSPLAIMGAFLYLIRNRFAENAGLNWVWRDDPATTDLVIEAQYNQNTEQRDVRPGIFIDRTETTYGKVSIGNQDQNQHYLLERDHMHYYSRGQTSLVIECVSPSRGESMQLADIVHSFLESSKYVIQAVFGFQDITPIVAGRTVPSEKQTDLHVTQLELRIDYETQWATIAAAPMLRSIGLELNEKHAPADAFFTNMYLKSGS